jgi:hypothetical protein
MQAQKTDDNSLGRDRHRERKGDENQRSDGRIDEHVQILEKG